MPDKSVKELCAEWGKALDEHRQSVNQYFGMEWVPYGEPMKKAPERAVRLEAREEIAELKRKADKAYAALQERFRAD